MLHDMDKTLENILRAEGKIGKNDVDIAFDQPTGEWSGKLNRPTLNLFCFDIRENIRLRRSGQVTKIDYNGNSARTAIAPRRIDLSYLVTAWARQVEDEHQLLWRSLQTLKGFNLLKPERCEGQLRYQSLDIPIVVADMSEPKVNLVDLWSVLENQMKLGFTVNLTLELETDIGFDSPLVLEGRMRVGQSSDPTKHELTTNDIEIKHPKNNRADG